jgi:hypothetical protein
MEECNLEDITYNIFIGENNIIRKKNISLVGIEKV